MIIEIKVELLLYHNKLKHINSDSYGQTIFQQCHEWCDMMEKEIEGMEEDNIIEWLMKYAKSYFMETDTMKGGITERQQEYSIFLAMYCWKYGFHLRLGLLLDNYNYVLDCLGMPGATNKGLVKFCEEEGK